jgi:hypothetical protein
MGDDGAHGSVLRFATSEAGRKFVGVVIGLQANVVEVGEPLAQKGIRGEG